ncbi:hypothetical protein FGADI_5207 [Fusarium gaditjirri]|uniref:Nucleoside phosphorylase domain-containing protein n=1 Tax=Fusarium gaditjirri TaxID=282569 RepID=A0A8H4WYM2_9HYPO|nr:hypothetical protein FGADI_5207 [Fusarium gaditjirri]
MASSESSQSWQPKRHRADSGDSTSSLQYDDYTVGWISALPLEMTAAQAMLDHRHEPLPRSPHDTNCYEFGSINGHNVVIACLPKAQYGNNNAAIVANNMNRTFPHLQHRLLVGIAGGAPGVADVRLGDIVVSTYAIQYDLGKALPNNHFQHIAEAIRPPQALLTAVSKVEASHNEGQVRMLEVLYNTAARLTRYAHPMLEDCLFQSNFNHTSPGTNCDGCDRTQLAPRQIRQNTNPVIHYGRVASGNQVIKDALTRDALSTKINNICFEMEAAGVMDCFPCLVIRGICDYSVSHKNKGWQEYAALVAAAYAKELLMSIPTTLLHTWKRARVQEPKTSEPISPEADDCLQAMFVTDSSLDREGILDAKGDICEGTCEWVLSTEEFQAWDQNPPHLLWISAPPGMGKTFMAIYLSQHLEALSKEKSGIATIFFFCDNKVDTRNTAVSILRGLMYQLISHQPNLVNAIIPQWKQQSRNLFRESSFGALWKLFEDMITNSEFRTIYCVIDGLDECEANSLSLLLRKFERFSRGNLGSSTKMKLVCLSRKYPENITEALLLFTKMELDIMTARKDDISRFISSQVQELAQKKNLSSKIRSNLEDTFQEKSEGTFLWISFMSQDLQKQGLLDFEKSLKLLPSGLDAVYERILQNVKFEKGGPIHGILYWILVATRPLMIPELCEAVDMKPTWLLTREEVCIELIKSCGHLLQITDEHMRGHSVQQTVTFLHQSAKDYLMKFDFRFGSQTLGLAIPQLHEHATIILLQYLERINSRKGIECKYLTYIPSDFPLANYAVNEWSFHFKQLEDITRFMQHGVRFFEKDSKVRRMWQHLYNLPEAYKNFEAVPLLPLSAFLGLDNLAEWCLEHDRESDVETKWGFPKQRALSIACTRHREYIFSLLLDAGADPIAAINLPSALFEALIFGNRRILNLIAQTKSCRGFLKKEKSGQDGTLIYVAAEVGNEDACRFLIEDLGWDLNWKSGSIGNSALLCALSSGNFELVSCFIKEWHVPLWDHSVILKEVCSNRASESDFERIIQLLLDHCSVNINTTDEQGHNALCFSFKHSYMRFSALSNTRILLQFGCSPDQPDRLGRTAMHCLTKRAHCNELEDFAAVMGLLVRSSQHGINQVDEDGQTVLHSLIESWFFVPTHDKPYYEALEYVPQAAGDLMDLGVDRYIQNSEGLTGLQMLQANQGRYKEMPERREARYRRCVDRTITLLESYCTVPRY